MIPRIRRVYIQNYKSIEKAWATLEPFTVLVGPNGVGKSNFVDALEFVKDCLSGSLDSAFQSRGGSWKTCSRFDPPFKKNIGIRLELDLDNDFRADYAFEIGVKRKHVPLVRILRERCAIWSSAGKKHTFEIQDGRFTIPIPDIRPVISPDRLALTVVSGIEEFRPVYDFLTTMRFYSIVPDRLREYRPKESGEFLARDGSNAIAVLQSLYKDEDRARRSLNRIRRLMPKISSGTQDVTYIIFASDRTIVSMRDSNIPHSFKFPENTDDGDTVHSLMFLQNMGDGIEQLMEAFHMSDGTLRALALLLAAYQLGSHSVIAIEEPEATIHPAAAEIILQVLQDASHDRQILITTHSPDILDSKDVSAEQIRVVGMQDGRTFISPVSESGRSIIRDKLYTPGELLRMDELKADEEKAIETSKKFNLFDELDSEDSESE